MNQGIARVALLEALEQRRFLNGNVTVTAGENFTATVAGDSRHNLMQITLAGADGYLIKGLLGTKINGGKELLLRSTTAANLNLSLGKGNDYVYFVGAFNTQTVSLSMGDGNDRVKIYRVSHFGGLNISAGSGYDSVTLANVNVTGDMDIDMGANNDLVLLATVVVDGNASVDGGSGRNAIFGRRTLAVEGEKSIDAFWSTRSDDNDDGDDDDDDDDRDHDDD